MVDWTAMRSALDGSDPNEVMDAFRKCCEFSYAMGSYQDVMSRSLDIFKHVFNITHLRVFKISGMGTKLSLSIENALSDVDQFSPSDAVDLDLRSVEAQLRLLSLTGVEIRQGVSVISIANYSYNFFILGTIHGHSSLFIWPQSSHRISNVIRAGHLDLLRSEVLIEAFVCQLQAVCGAIARMEESESMLYRDELTGLYNYRSLEQTLDAELKRYFRFKTPFSLLFIDLDNFKPINDTYGHLVGSEVLKQVAKVLCDTTRDVDSVYRYGGDEFVIMLVESTGDHALRVAERLRASIEQHCFKASSETFIQLTASIGVASCPDHGKDRQLLLQMADDSMYRSKRAGKNKVLIVGNGHALDKNMSPLEE